MDTEHLGVAAERGVMSTPAEGPQRAFGFVCSNCNGSGMDKTWHEGAPCAEVHQCGYCMGMTDRPEPSSSAGSTSSTNTAQEGT